MKSATHPRTAPRGRHGPRYGRVARRMVGSAILLSGSLIFAAEMASAAAPRASSSGAVTLAFTLAPK